MSFVDDSDKLGKVYRHMTVIERVFLQIDPKYHKYIIRRLLGLTSSSNKESILCSELYSLDCLEKDYFNYRK